MPHIFHRIKNALAIAYLRVSIEKREMEAQKKAIEEFARRRDFEIVWFTGEAISGSIKVV